MAFARLDLRIFPIVFCLMGISLLVISSMTEMDESLGIWTPFVKSQLRWYLIGWIVFFIASSIDYRALRPLSPFLYVFFLALLLGLFFVSPIQNVHRWYRLPGGLGSFQPSEQAKLALILFLSWFLEKKEDQAHSLKTSLQMGLIVLVPFVLIAKEPDLGTALILYPIAIVMGFFAKIHSKLLKGAIFLGLIVLGISASFFLRFLSHEDMRPYLTQVIKEYQYERLNPDTYHQKAAATALAVGGWSGTGWKKGIFAGKHWLPAAHTDSVFAAFGEEFGLLGIGALLFLFYALIYCCFQVVAVAKDPFGRYLAAGLSAYLAMHVFVNAAMMCSILPISGVPLVFISYGGTSLVTTMGALGLLQSVYLRRFLF